jgi:hypothetical protein
LHSGLNQGIPQRILRFIDADTGVAWRINGLFENDAEYGTVSNLAIVVSDADGYQRGTHYSLLFGQISSDSARWYHCDSIAGYNSTPAAKLAIQICIRFGWKYNRVEPLAIPQQAQGSNDCGSFVMMAMLLIRESFCAGRTSIAEISPLLHDIRPVEDALCCRAWLEELILARFTSHIPTPSLEELDDSGDDNDEPDSGHYSVVTAKNHSLRGRWYVAFGRLFFFFFFLVCLLISGHVP